MNKVIVIGSAGAGKSVFSRKLGEKTGLPVIHLDMIWHRPDKTHITRDEFDRFLEKTFKEERWIMDGDYSRTLEVRMQNADTIILLDYPVETCMEGIKARVGVKREDMPWIADSIDGLKETVENYPTRELPIVYELIGKYKENREIIVLKSREEAEIFLQS